MTTAAPLLRPHQAKAVADVEAAFKKGSTRTQLILPCGTGKTRVGAALATSLEGAAADAPVRVVVFVPSLTLVEQTLNEWHETHSLHAGPEQNKSGAIDPIVVCSDATTSAGLAEREGDPDYSPRLAWHQKRVPVTTDPDRLARLLSRAPRHGVQVVISTYHSADILATAIKYAATTVRFDLLIADEAHRLAGQPSQTFRLVLEDDAIPADRRLFMTATPIVAPKRSGHLSMDDTRTFGTVAHQMTFAAAISAGLLCDYRVLVIAEPAQQDSPSADEDHLGLAALAALRSAAVTAPLSRVLTFHSRIRAAERFVGFLNQAGDLDDGRPTWARVVSSDTTAAERRKTLTGLAEDSSAFRVVASARCLSEGVDLPAVDGVAFCSPKTSLVDIIQSVGRVLRLSPDKAVGTIVIPVALPRGLAAGGDDDSALLASSFGHVWMVLRALRAHDERLAAEVDQIVRDVARRGVRTGDRITDRVSWLLPPGMESRVLTRTVFEVGEGWERMFGLLERYVDDHGHARVTAKSAAQTMDTPTMATQGNTSSRDSEVGVPSPSSGLMSWVEAQRLSFRRGVLPADRAERLASLPGWVWTTADARWEDNFEALRKQWRASTNLEDLSAAKAHGTVHRTLGEYAAAQRVAYRNEQLSADRAERLEGLPGWQWHLLSEVDETMVDALADYVAWEGDPNVADDYVDGTLALGAWLAQLRRRRVLRTAPAALLDEVAAVTPGRHTENALRWEARETTWRLGLDAARQFYAREQHLKVPDNHVETLDGTPVRLHRWMVARRFENRSGQLTPERVALIESVPGWRWEIGPAPRTAVEIGNTPHGTRTGYVKGCRCEDCTESNRTYRQQQDELRRSGTETSRLVPTDAAKQLLRELVAAGATLRAISRESGISRNCVRDLANGSLEHVTRDTVARLEALKPEDVRANVGSATLVDAAPTWAQLNLLLDHGWPKSWLARELGGSGDRPALQIRKERVTAETARRVAVLAERVGDRIAPARARGEQLPSLADLEKQWRRDQTGALLVDDAA